MRNIGFGKIVVILLVACTQMASLAMDPNKPNLYTVQQLLDFSNGKDGEKTVKNLLKNYSQVDLDSILGRLYSMQQTGSKLFGIVQSLAQEKQQPSKKPTAKKQKSKEEEEEEAMQDLLDLAEDPNNVQELGREFFAESLEIIQSMLTTLDKRKLSETRLYKILKNIERAKQKKGSESKKEEIKKEQKAPVITAQGRTLTVDVLNRLNLCLHPNPKYKYVEVSQLAGGGNYRRQNKRLADQLPCYSNSIPNFELFQPVVIDQFTLAEKKGMEPAICSLTALYGMNLIRDFINTGDESKLRNLANIDSAANYLNKFDFRQFPTVEELKNILGRDYNINQLGLIDNVLAFSNNPDETVFVDELAVNDAKQIKQLFANAQKSKAAFNYSLLLGTGDDAKEGRGHYFGILFNKPANANKWQVIIVDTAPAAYHLLDDTYEQLRIKYLLDALLNNGGRNIPLIKYIQG